jgi:membrane protein implicated in regulation of membrane protease activity
VAIDFVWAHPTLSKSDQPHLNRPAMQLVGRVLLVEEAIENGRGKVRVGDTVWPAEGPDVPSGTLVRVTQARGTLLVVEPH